jgi:hypothetical protein
LLLLLVLLVLLVLLMLLVVLLKVSGHLLRPLQRRNRRAWYRMQQLLLLLHVHELQLCEMRSEPREAHWHRHGHLLLCHRHCQGHRRRHRLRLVWLGLEQLRSSGGRDQSRR